MAQDHSPWNSMRQAYLEEDIFLLTMMMEVWTSGSTAGGDKSPNNNDGHCKKANEVSETLKILNHNHYFLENRQEELMCIGKQRKTTF